MKVKSMPCVSTLFKIWKGRTFILRKLLKTVPPPLISEIEFQEKVTVTCLHMICLGNIFVSVHVITQSSVQEVLKDFCKLLNVSVVVTKWSPVIDLMSRWLLWMWILEYKPSHVWCFTALPAATWTSSETQPNKNPISSISTGGIRSWGLSCFLRANEKPLGVWAVQALCSNAARPRASFSYPQPAWSIHGLLQVVSTLPTKNNHLDIDPLPLLP